MLISRTSLCAKKFVTVPAASYGTELRRSNLGIRVGIDLTLTR
jgi:hypothetical protein